MIQVMQMKIEAQVKFNFIFIIPEDIPLSTGGPMSGPIGPIGPSGPGPIGNCKKIKIIQFIRYKSI